MRFVVWVTRTGKNQPEYLLSLLLRAHRIHDQQQNFAMGFRAGLKIGRRYPEIAAEILKDEPEYNI